MHKLGQASSVQWALLGILFHFLVAAAPAGTPSRHVEKPSRPAREEAFTGFQTPSTTSQEQALITLEDNVRILLKEHETIKKLHDEFEKYKYDVNNRWACREFLKDKAAPKFLARYESFFDAHGKILIEKKVYQDANLRYWFPENPPKLKKLLERQYIETTRNRDGMCEDKPYMFVWHTLWYKMKEIIQGAIDNGLPKEKLSPRLLFLGGFKEELQKRANVYLSAPSERTNDGLPLQYRAVKAHLAGDKDKAHALAWATASSNHESKQPQLGRVLGGGVARELNLDAEEYLKKSAEEYKGVDENLFRISFDEKSVSKLEDFEKPLWESEKAFYKLIDRLHKVKSNPNADELTFAKSIYRRCFPYGKIKDDKITDAVIDEIANCVIHRFTDQASLAQSRIKEIIRKQLESEGKKVESRADFEAINAKSLNYIPPGTLVLLERFGRSRGNVPLSEQVLSIAKRIRDKVKEEHGDIPQGLLLMAREDDYYRGGYVDSVAELYERDRKASLDWIAKIITHKDLSAKDKETLQLFTNVLKVDRTRGKGTEDLTHTSLRGTDPSKRQARPQVASVESPIKLPEDPGLKIPPWRQGYYLYPKEKIKESASPDLKKACEVAGDDDKYEAFRKEHEVYKAYSLYFDKWDLPKKYGNDGEEIMKAMKALPVSAANELKKPFAAIIEKYYGVKWDDLLKTTKPQTYYQVSSRIRGYLIHLTNKSEEEHYYVRNQCLATPYMAKVFDIIQSQLEILGNIKPENMGKEKAEALLKEKFKDFLLAETGENIDTLFKDGTDFLEVKKKIAQALLKKYLAAYRPIEFSLYHSHGEIKLPFEQHFLAARAQRVVPQTASLPGGGVPRQFRERVDELMKAAGIKTDDFMRFYEGKMSPDELSTFKVKLKSLMSHPQMEKSPEFASAVGLLNHWAGDQPHNPLLVFADGDNARYRSSKASDNARGLLAQEVASAPPVTYEELSCEDDGVAFFNFVRNRDPKLSEVFLGKPEPLFSLFTSKYFSHEKLSAGEFLQKFNDKEKGKELRASLYYRLSREGDIDKSLDEMEKEKDPFKAYAEASNRFARKYLLEDFLKGIKIPESKEEVKPLPRRAQGNTDRAKAVAERVQSIRLKLNYTQRALLALNAKVEEILAPYLPAEELSFDFHAAFETKRIRKELLESFMKEFQKMTADMDAQDRLALPPDALLLADRVAKFQYGLEKRNRDDKRRRAGALEVELRSSSVREPDKKRAEKEKLDQEWKQHEKNMAPLLSQQFFLDQAILRLRYLPREVKAAQTLANALERIREEGMSTLTKDQFDGNILLLRLYCAKEENEKYCKGSSMFSDLEELLGLLYVVGDRNFEAIKPDIYTAYHKRGSEQPDPLLEGSGRYFSSCSNKIFIADVDSRIGELLAAVAPRKPVQEPPGKGKDGNPQGPGNNPGGNGTGKPPVQAGPMPPKPPVEAPRPGPPKLAWANPETFVGADGKPKSDKFLNATTPFRKMPDKADSFARGEVLKENKNLLAEALDLLVPGKKSPEELMQIFGKYYKSKFGEDLKEPTEKQRHDLRLALISDYLDQIVESGSLGERGRLSSAMNLLPRGARNGWKLDQVIRYLNPTGRASDIARRHNTILDWIRKVQNSQAVRNDPAMEALALLSTAIDDHWSKSGHADHSKALEHLQAEVRRSKSNKVTADRIDDLEEEAQKHGIALPGKVRQWILDNPDIAQKVTDISYVLMNKSNRRDKDRLSPKALFDALLAKDARGELEKLHNMWGRFALIPIPSADKFKDNRQGFIDAVRAADSENKKRLLELIEGLKKGKFTYGEIQQLLGDYLLRTRGFTPFQMLSVLDPRFGINGTTSNWNLHFPIDKKHLDPIIAQLQMDALGMGHYFRQDTPLPGRPDLSTNFPALVGLSQKFKQNLGTGAKRDEIGYSALLRRMVDWRDSTRKHDRDFIKREIPFLDKYQREQLIQVVNVLRKLPSTHVPDDESLSHLIAKEVFRIYPRTQYKPSWNPKTEKEPDWVKVPIDQQYPPAIQEDIKQLLSAVKGLHSVAYPDKDSPELSDYQKNLAPLWFAQAAMADHPERILQTKWLVRQLNESKKAADFLENLGKYDEPWVSSEDIQKVLKEINPEFKKTDPDTQKALRAVANFLRAARWVEQEWKEKGRSKVDDKRIKEIIGHAIYGLRPGTELTEDQKADIDIDFKWVKMALHFLEKGPLYEGAHKTVSDYLAKHIHAGVEGLTEEDKNYDFQDAATMFEYLRLVKMFSPKESSRAKYIAAHEAPLQRDFIDNWSKSILMDQNHFSSILPTTSLAALASAGESRDELLRRINSIQRRLSDKPPEIKLEPEDTGNRIIISYEPDHKVRMWSYIDELLKEPDPQKFALKLQAAAPIIIEDASLRHYKKFGAKRPQSSTGSDEYAPALAVFRCRLLDAMQTLIRGDTANDQHNDHHDRLVFSTHENSPLGRRRLLKIYAKLVLDVEVKLLDQVSDDELDLSAYRSKLKEVDPATYLSVLRQRIRAGELSIPGCSYVKEKKKKVYYVDGKKHEYDQMVPTSRLAWNGRRLDFYRWDRNIIHPPSAVTDDGDFLAFLNGHLMERKGDRAYAPFPQSASRTREKDYPAFYHYGRGSVLADMGFPSDWERLTLPNQSWAETKLKGLKEPQKSRLESRLKSAEKEAAKLDERVVKLLKDRWTVPKKQEVESAWKMLQKASNLRAAIYRDIAEEFTRQHSVAPMVLPSVSEMRLLGLPDHTRSLLGHLVVRNRYRQDRILNISHSDGEIKPEHLDYWVKKLNVSPEILKSHAKGKQFARDLMLRTNRLLLEPDLSTIVYEAWQDPELRRHLLDGIWHRLPHEDRYKFIEKDLVDKVAGWDKFSIEEKEKFRDLFLKAFEELKKPSDFEKNFNVPDHAKKNMAKRRLEASSLLAMLFRVLDEGDSLKFAQENSEFAKAYEGVMGGDRRFNPEVAHAELKREREVSKKCKTTPAPRECHLLEKHIAKMHALGRDVSTQTRRRFLDVEDREKLTDADFRQLERLEKDILPHVITSSGNNKAPKLALELLRAVPSPVIVDEISRKYDLKRYLSTQLEEQIPTLSTDIIDLMLKSAENGKVMVLQIGKNEKGDFSSTFVQKECKDVKGLDGTLFEKGGEIVLRLMPTEKDADKLKSDVGKLARVSAYKKAYDKFKTTQQREPSFEELKEQVSDEVVEKEYQQVLARLSNTAAQRYLEKITKGKSEEELATLNLSSPSSKHGCAMRALLGPKLFSDTDQAALKRILAEHDLELVKATGKLPPMTEDQQKKVDDARNKYVNSPDVLHAMDKAYGDVIAKHDGKQDEVRWRPLQARVSNALREHLPACFEHFKKNNIKIPKTMRDIDPKEVELAKLLEQEKLGMRSFHQITRIENSMFAKAADLSFSPTSLDLKWFTDPKNGRIALTERQLKLFKDPDKNPHLNEEHMQKSIKRMEEDLERYKSQAKNLEHRRAELRLHLEASMSSPIEGDITQEELQVNHAIINRTKYLIYKKIKEEHEKIAADKRPRFAAFPSLSFIGSLEQDPELRRLVNAFNVKKTTEMDKRRDEYKLPKDYSARGEVPTLDNIKLRGMIRRTASLVHLERSEEIQKLLEKLAITNDVNTQNEVRNDFDKLAVKCMELLLKEGKVGFKQTNAGGEKQFIPEDIETVRNQLLAFEDAKESLRNLIDSLLPPANVQKTARGRSEAFAKHIQEDPSFKKAIAHLQSDKSPVRMTEKEAMDLASIHLLNDVFDKREQENHELTETIKGLTELGFKWDGAGLSWGVGDEGLKLHLIGRPGTRINSLAALKFRLEKLRKFGVFRHNGVNPWRMLLDDIWAEYAKSGFKPIFEYGNSALCMADIIDTTRGDGYYQGGGKTHAATDGWRERALSSNNLSEGNRQAANLCLLNKFRVKDGKRYNLAKVPPDYSDRWNAMPDNFLTDFNNAEKYFSFMSLTEAREYAQLVHDHAKSNVSGEGSDYHKAVMDIRGQSSNLWAGFDVTAKDPTTGEWNGPWNGIAKRFSDANDLLTEEHRKLTEGIRSLERMGAIKINVSTDGGSVEQPASVVAQSYRQQQQYIMNPELFTHLPREVMENIDNMEQFIYEEIAIELATLATLGLAKVAQVGLRGVQAVRAARYARLIAAGSKGIELITHSVKGIRSAYRFALGGKAFADLISNWDADERGYTITQPLSPEHTHRSAMVFAALPLVTPAFAALARIGGIPARLIPWIANPLAMGGTHYAVELLHGADPKHALVGSIPMALFGLASPLASGFGKVYGHGMKTPVLGRILRPAWVRNTLSYGAAQTYFSGVTGLGAVLQHWATPEVHRDPETGEAIFRDPRTGKEIKDATLVDIVLLSMQANIGMDAFFAKNHVREIQAHAAAHLVRAGVPYKSVLELFGGNNPKAQQNAHGLIMEGLAHTTSVKDWRSMREKRSNLEKKLEKDPTDPKARAELDALKQVMALIARSGGHGTAEMGVFEESAIAEYNKRLENYADGSYGNHMLFVLNAKIARETYLKRAAALQEKPNGGSLKEWVELLEDPSFAGAADVALATIPPEMLRNGLRNGTQGENNPQYAKRLANVIHELAAHSGISHEAVPGLVEFLKHYKSAKGENLYAVARRFRNLEYRQRPKSRNPIARAWKAKWEDPVDIASASRSGEFSALVAEGKMTTRGLAKVAEALPEVLDNLRLADVHVLQRQAKGKGPQARDANYLLDVLAKRFGLDRQLFEESVARVSKNEPNTPDDAVFGKTRGKKLAQLEEHFIPEAAKKMQEDVAAGTTDIDDLISMGFFNEEENFKYVPPDKFDLDNKPDHREYVDRASGLFLDAHPKFKWFLVQRGIPFENFKEAVRNYLRTKPKAHSNLADAIVHAQGAFMGSPAIRNHFKPGETQTAEYNKLVARWRKILPELEKGDAASGEAKAEWKEIAPELMAFVEYGNFKTEKGDPDIPAMVKFLEQAQRNCKHCTGETPVAELVVEASRLARLDMAKRARDGEIPIESLLNHDLFKLSVGSSEGDNIPKYPPETAAVIPQDLVIRAFHKADPNSPEKQQLARHIVALSEAAGYTHKDAGAAFVNFVLRYNDPNTTVPKLAHLFNNGSARELGKLVVDGVLDVDAIALLPEGRFADFGRGTARFFFLDPANSRTEAVIRQLRVKDVSRLIAQSKDENHANHENAKKTLEMLSKWLYTDPAFLTTFMEGYAQVKEAGPRTWLPSWLGGVAEPRQERPMSRVAKQFWKSQKDNVQKTLDADPSMVDRMIDADFFSQEGSYSYLPPNSLIIGPRARPVPDGNGGTRMKTFVRPNPKHVALVEKAATDAFKDPVFAQQIKNAGVDGTTANKEFTDRLKQKLIDDPKKYPDLQSAIDATKAEYVREKTSPTTSSLYLPDLRAEDLLALGFERARFFKAA